MDEYEWGDASVGHPDWIGTVQLDQKMTGTTDIYSLTGIDHDEWQIIGLDFGAGLKRPPASSLRAVSGRAGVDGLA